MRISDLFTSVGINAALVLLFLFLYSIFRVQWINARVYYARHFVRDKGWGKRRELGFKEELKRQAKGMLGWVPSAVKTAMNEDELLRVAGVDAVVFMRIFRTAIHLFAVACFVGLVVLLPINVTDEALAIDAQRYGNFTVDELDTLTIANVQNGSKRLWAHLIAVYFITFYTFALLYREFRSIAYLRQRQIAAARPAPDQFTVLVIHVPRRQHKKDGVSRSDMIERFFNKYHALTTLVNHPVYRELPDGEEAEQPITRADEFFRKVHRLTYHLYQPVYQASHLEKLHAKRKQLERQLFKAGELLRRHPEKRPTMRLGWKRFLGLGEKVDTIDWTTQELTRLTAEARAERNKILAEKDDAHVVPAAFVSFKSRWGAAVAAQTQQSPNPLLWQTQWAPEPRDVYWPNLSMPYWENGTRRLLVTAAVFAIVFFYLIPVTFVQGLTELRTLSRWVPGARALASIPVVSQLITGYLPALILTIFLALMPMVMMLLSKMEGRLSLSSLDKVACSKMFYFLVVNVFFGTVFAGSVFNKLNSFIDQPKSIPNALAAAIPQKSTFFITYIVTSWAGFAQEALQTFSLVRYYLQYGTTARTETDRERARPPPTMPLHSTAPNLLIFVLLGLVYFPVAPLLLPFLLFYFLLGFAVWANELIHVYEPAYESYGQFWPFVHNRFIASLVIMQLMMAGLLGLKRAPIAAPLIVPLIVLTLLFHKFCNDRFLATFSNYSLQSAADKDLAESDAEFHQDLAFLQDAYLHPGLREEAFEDAVNDVEEGRRREVEDAFGGPSRFIEAPGNMGVAVKPTLPDPYDIPEPNERLDAADGSDTSSLRPPGSPQSEHGTGDRIVPAGRPHSVHEQHAAPGSEITE